jgi:protease I
VKLKGKKIAVLLESDFCEHEIWYYKFRFAEEGAEVVFLTRLWGHPSLTFIGHDHQVPFLCDQSFENMEDDQLAEYSAIIVPSGFVADRLRYTQDLSKLPPATSFIERAFANPSILKGFICHGLWLLAPSPDLVRGRKVVSHNNLYGDVINMGAQFVDEDVVVDSDLVTARTGDHCHLFARKIIELLSDTKVLQSTRIPTMSATP